MAKAKRKKSRKTFTDETKVAACERVRGGVLVKDECQRLGIFESTLRAWLKDDRYVGGLPQVSATRRKSASGKQWRFCPHCGKELK
jgi:transposase-like protein